MCSGFTEVERSYRANSDFWQGFSGHMQCAFGGKQFLWVFGKFERGYRVCSVFGKDEWGYGHFTYERQLHCGFRKIERGFRASSFSEAAPEGSGRGRAVQRWRSASTC